MIGLAAQLKDPASRSILEVGPSLHIWSATDCKLLAERTGELHREVPNALSDLVKTAELRAQEMDDVIKQFVFAIPKVGNTIACFVEQA